MSLLALMTLAGSLAAADAPEHAVPSPIPAPPSRVEFGAKGSVAEIEGDEFSVATFNPFPDPNPDPADLHFHSAGQGEFSVGSDFVEVGECCDGGSGEEVRGLAEFPVTGEGASGATLSFEVERLGGLFNQPATNFGILIEAYIGNNAEDEVDYLASPIQTIGSFNTAGLQVGQVLEYDVSDVFGSALSSGSLGIRLRANNNPMGGALTFQEFLIEKFGSRSSFGGLGASFCPTTGGLGKGSCTDDLVQSDRFGSAISVSGNTVVIGVPGDDDAGQNSGAAFVFLRDRGNLLFQQKLLVPPQFIAGGFGKSIKVANGILVVGAPDEPTFSRKGATGMRAAIFERLNQGWSFKVPVTSTVSTANSGFGTSIGLEGNTMVIGAPGQNAASVFTFNNGFPVEIGVVGPPGGKGGNQAFGRSVAVSNGKFAVAGGTPVLAGTLGLFEAVGNNLATLGSMTGTDASSNFGASIAMDGNNVFVGAPQARVNSNGTGNRTGVVFGVGLNGNPRGRFTPPNPFAGGLFGQSLAANGGRLAVGQPGGGPGGKGGDTASRVYLFDATVDSLGQVDQLTAQTAGEDGIGTAVALDRGNLLAASPDTGTLTGVLDTREVFGNDFEGVDASLAAQDVGSRCPAGFTRTQLLFIDDLESGAAGWSVSGSNASWALQSDRASSGVRAWKASGSSAATDQILSTPVIQRPALSDPNTELFVLSFKQFRNIEEAGGTCFDGAVVELADPDADVVQTLSDDFIIQDSYTGPIADGTGNPLADFSDSFGNMVELAWCGVTAQSVETQVISFNSQPTQRAVRFRYGTDGSVATEGWYIDDVILEVCTLAGQRAPSGTPAATSAGPAGADIPVRLP